MLDTLLHSCDYVEICVTDVISMNKRAIHLCTLHAFPVSVQLLKAHQGALASVAQLVER